MHAFRRAIAQVACGEQSTEDGALGVPTTSGVEGVAVLRVAEPLRRAALAALELTLAPEADRVHCSRSDHAGIAVHNVLPPIRSRALQRPQRRRSRAEAFYPNSDIRSPTQAEIDLRRRVTRVTCGPYRGAPTDTVTPELRLRTGATSNRYAWFEAHPDPRAQFREHPTRNPENLP